jgi:uncharacterized membrane protein YoaK (UPF0700 family)
MPLATDPRHTRLKRAVALVLTFAAGIADIVGYLALYHTFTAHMTGTTVHLGNSLAEAHWRESALAASVVAAFVIGSLGGRIAIEIGARKRIRSIASVTLALEAILLLAVIPVGNHSLAAHGSGESTLLTAILLAMLAGAMGLQTATLTRVGPLTVHTTFVTGMLNKLAQLVARALYASWDARRRTPKERTEHDAKRRQAASQALFLFGIWLMYLAGAALGTVLHQRWGLLALLVAVAALVIAIGADLVQPLSIEEEKEQSER